METDGSGTGGGRSAGRATPRKPRSATVTSDWLMRAALAYLERYATSSGHLRQVLARKIRRRRQAGAHDGDEAVDVRCDGRIENDDDARLIEETLAKLLVLKLLDDTAFAEARLASLRRRGASMRGAKAKLAVNGLDRSTIETAAAKDETSDAAAARRFAERRRFGPHRLRDRELRRDRDIAAMMRAGFSFRDARAAVDDEPADER